MAEAPEGTFPLNSSGGAMYGNWGAPQTPIQSARAATAGRHVRSTKAMRGQAILNQTTHHLDLAEQIAQVLHQLPAEHAAEVLTHVASHPLVQPAFAAASGLENAATPKPPYARRVSHSTRPYTHKVNR